MPQANPVAVPDRHRADSDVSAARRYSRERARASRANLRNNAAARARIHATVTSRASESYDTRRFWRSREIF